MSSRRSIFTRPDTIRLIPLIFLIPVTAAAFAPPIDDVEDLEVGDRSRTLHPISRMVDASKEWQIVARFEDPIHRNWTLVVWHDGPQRRGLIDPCELVVFTQTSTADALVANSLCEHAGPCDPMSPDAIADPAFARSTRRDIRYCARVVASAEDPNSVTLTMNLLAERVRELDKPRLLLTSTPDRADQSHVHATRSLF
jgi:hypothetical protein